MARIERWMESVFPGVGKGHEEYAKLSERELAIVGAAVLDVALAELLDKRLAGKAKEREEFLGINGDGRAPAGTFGARIQLAHLTGTIPQKLIEMLRAIKELRNVMAHRVRVDFSGELPRKALVRLFNALMAMSPEFPHREAASKGFHRDIMKPNHAVGRYVVLSAVIALQEAFAELHPDCPRILPWWTRGLNAAATYDGETDS